VRFSAASLRETEGAGASFGSGTKESQQFFYFQENRYLCKPVEAGMDHINKQVLIL